MTAGTVAIVLACLLFFVVSFIALLAASRFKRPTKLPQEEVPDEEKSPEYPEGFLLISEDELGDLRHSLAELNRLIGEERAQHKADLASVQQQAELEMQKFRSALELENAQKKRSEAKATAARSRASLVAKIGEHFAPLLGGFPYNFKDCRHVGEIFDFLVFDGLEDGEIRQVVFLEVKTKRSGARVTNPREKLLRDAINAGRVKYDIFVPDVTEAKGLAE